MKIIEYDIVIIGGGPAGSSAALFLVKAGLNVCLIEKKKFPREVLCGEFLSVEVSAILKELNLFDDFLYLNPVKISTFRYVIDNGREISANLEFPAYALKRSVFDAFLLNNASKSGTSIYQPSEVIGINKEKNNFFVDIKTEGNEDIKIKSNYVIAAYGKQNILDKKLRRNFSSKGTVKQNIKTGFNGIKFHLQRKMIKNFPMDEIRIYAVNKIYFGLNSVSNEEITLCFLEKRVNDDISGRNRIIELLRTNKNFRNLFEENPENIFDNLLVYGTGNIYFGKKKAVEDGIYFIGDAAGMIAPLTGDGIGIAMSSAKILSNLIIEQNKKGLNRNELENQYSIKWKQAFSRRTKISYLVQRSLLNRLLLNLFFSFVQTFPLILSYIIKSTRGNINK